jgi:hypothetical protein
MTRVFGYRSFTAEKWFQSQVSQSWPGMRYFRDLCLFPVGNIPSMTCTHLSWQLITLLNKVGNVRVGNIEAHSRNHCCCGKGKIITYYERVFLVVVMEHVMHKCRVIWSVQPYHIFPNYLIRFSENSY